MAEEQGRVADLLVRCLENEGVTCIFGLPGEENIRFTDAVARSSIRYVLVRHEQAASFMAEIHGRLTGRAGVCSSTLGPGAINLLLGTADANSNSTPLVAISAQVGLHRIYKESHQSVDLVAMFDPVTKWADMVLTAGAVPEMVRKAFKLAQTERPGAVFLAVPEDIEGLYRCEDDVTPLAVNVPRPDEPSPSQIARAAAVLEAEQPTDRARRPRSGEERRRRCPDPLLRAPGTAGCDQLPRKGRVPRRSSQCPRRGGVHEPRLCQLRLRRGRRDHQRGLRAPGVRSAADQSPRGQAHHSSEPVPGRGRRAL